VKPESRERVIQNQRECFEILDRAALVVGEIGRRLKRVEGGYAMVRPDAYITDEQAAGISLRVKALARLMGGESTHYQSVFTELYRRFGVASYKLVRMEQYEEVLGFLEEWRQEAGS
jgi:hypothetical protein